MSRYYDPVTHRFVNANGYTTATGTSLAAPHVAGTLAMMKGINYDLTPAQLLTRLKNRSTSTITGRVDTSKEFKFLNVGKAVELMAESGLD